VPKPEYVQALRQDSAAIEVAGARDLHAAVPACPGWQLGDLVDHVGQIHRWVTAMVEANASERYDRKSQPQSPRKDSEKLAWFRQGAARLVEALETAGEETPVWNWSQLPHLSAFWHRRMAHETSIHRWDAESAAAIAAPIAAELATDGIDELLEVFLPRLLATLPTAADLGGALAVRTTDTDRVWVIDCGRLADPANAGEAGAAVSADASTVLLFLYNRVGIERLEVNGDITIAANGRDRMRW